MKYWTRNKIFRIAIVVAAALVFFGLGILVQAMATRLGATPAPYDTLQAENTLRPNEEEVLSASYKLAADATVLLTTVFEECGHSTSRVENVTGAMQGLTRNELMAMLPQYTLTSFSPTNVKGIRTVRSWCAHHYILKEEAHQLAIYRPDDDGNLVFVQWLHIDSAVFSDAFMQSVKKGMAFETLEQIEYLIEDYAS